jgi:hypothetical protein
MEHDEYRRRHIGGQLLCEMDQGFDTARGGANGDDVMFGHPHSFIPAYTVPW